MPKKELIENFKDKDGNVINVPSNYQVYLVTPDQNDKFNIPYILTVPKDMKAGAKMIIATNNHEGMDREGNVVGSTTQALIDHSLTNDINAYFKMDVGAPAITPIIPSVEGGKPYYQQLAKECLESDPSHPYYRIDNQVCNMFEHAKGEIEGITDKKPGEKAVVFGHSASGAFGHHFALLHPEIIDTLVIGGNGDTVPVPFGDAGKELGYPLGIKDFKELTGNNFNEEAYKKMKIQMYLGDKEHTNPMYDVIRKGHEHARFVPPNQSEKYKGIYGQTLWERFYNAVEAYEENGCNIGIKLYEDDCHGPIRPDDFKGIYNEERYFEGTSNKIRTVMKQNQPTISTETCKERVSHVDRNQIGNVLQAIVSDREQEIGQKPNINSIGRFSEPGGR